MAKKQKGINQDTEIGTVSTLLQRINEEYSKRQKEAEVKDRANGELLAVAIKKEKALTDERATAKKVVEKMVKDYRKVELDVIAAKTKEVTKDVLRESDVKSGKISLRAFHRKGKFDKEISEEVLKKSVSELEISLNVIRSKNLEILEIEEKLGDCRNTIRGLTLRPGITMLEMLKGLYEFTDVQVAEFMGELESLRLDWNQAKEKIHWTQGKGLSLYYRWDQLTIEKARAVVFDPILPLSCCKKLLSEIEKYKDAETVNIAYYLRTKEVSVESITLRRGLIQTGDTKKVPDAEFKRI